MCWGAGVIVFIETCVFVAGLGVKLRQDRADRGNDRVTDCGQNCAIQNDTSDRLKNIITKTNHNVSPQNAPGEGGVDRDDLFLGRCDEREASRPCR